MDFLADFDVFWGILALTLFGGWIGYLIGYLRYAKKTSWKNRCIADLEWELFTLKHKAYSELSDFEKGKIGKPNASIKYKEYGKDIGLQKLLLLRQIREARAEVDLLIKLRARSKSILSSIPYFARIIADFDTRGLNILINQLNWGDNQERKKKVASLRVIKQETKEQIAKYKEAEYQLAYAIQMFPALQDFLDAEYTEVSGTGLSDLSAENHDATRNYLSAEEYTKLSTAERNQLALDRYFDSHKKSNWQIGRDYEHYVGYRYTQKGYAVEYYGSLKGLEDLGRDLIAKKGDQVLIIQCKYWSAKKQIHEKHINQLYGTMVAYGFENELSPQNVHGVFVTNITLTDTAKRFAAYLGIEIVESFALGKYPCIKCNINRDNHEKIYHLPFDQQYDTAKIDAPGEFFAMTVAEAENAGFRRAFRWHDN